MINAKVLEAIQDERSKQDLEWGGADHDDLHTTADWFQYIDKQRMLGHVAALNGQEPLCTQRLVKVAALAIAALESLHRRQKQVALESLHRRQEQVAAEKSSKLTVKHLEEFQTKDGCHYLTCEMVTWAQDQIGSNSPDKEKLLDILQFSFTRSSPMWRQSHYYLKDFLKSHGRYA